jgi:hypothetical protein
MSLEFTKRLDRDRVMRFSSAGRRFSDRFEEHLPLLRQRAEEIRADVLAELRELDLEEEQLVEQLAGDFDRGRWRCLGYGEHELRRNEWHQDDFHGHAWPRAYFASIDFVASETRCDVKVPWEKSRLQWATGAALACCLDSDDNRRHQRHHAVRDLILDWIEHNAYGVGVNWVSAMEVAIRGINLTLAFIFLGDRLEKEDQEALATSIGEHVHYLRRFPETSDVQGNHYLATELGIYFLSQLVEGSGSPGDPTTAFLEACEGQFTSDGLHTEFSPTYHRLSLDMVVIGQTLMRRLRPEQATRLDPLIGRGVRACLLLANGRGELPVFGDNDSGKVLDFGQPSRCFGAYRRVAPWSGGEGDVLPSERLFGAVLAGLRGEASPPPITGVRFEEITSLPPYVVWSRRQDKLVIRAGELGLAGRASHDHDDNLSFWFSVNGRDVIVESGCPPYTRDRAERKEAISSGAHNVISGADSCRFQPGQGSVCLTLRGGPRGKTRIIGEPGREKIEAELLTGGAAGMAITHTRTFERPEDGVLLIEDRFRLPAHELFEHRLHVPGESATIDLEQDTNTVTVAIDDVSLRITFGSRDTLSVEARASSSSMEYGAATDATCLVVRGPAKGKTLLQTRITVSAPGRAEC